MVMKDAPPKTLSCMSETLRLNVNNMQPMIQKDQKKYSYTMMLSNMAMIKGAGICNALITVQENLVLCHYTARRLYMLNCKLILLTRWKCLLHNFVKLNIMNIIDRHNISMINGALLVRIMSICLKHLHLVCSTTWYIHVYMRTDRRTLDKWLKYYPKHFVSGGINAQYR